MNFEFAILDGIQSLMQCEFLDTLTPMITNLASGGIIWILASLLFLIIPRTRKVGAMMAVALLLEFIFCNGIIKTLVGRARPCDINSAFQLLIPRPSGSSFPSGHTAASFAVASAMFIGRKELVDVRWWKALSIAALVLASLIAFTRLYLYVHFPTDVLGGIVLGVLAAWAGRFIVNRISS